MLGSVLFTQAIHVRVWAESMLFWSYDDAATREVGKTELKKSGLHILILPEQWNYTADSSKRLF